MSSSESEDNFYEDSDVSAVQSDSESVKSSVEEDEADDSGSFDIDELPILKQKRPLLSEKDLQRFKAEKDRTGVVYISRIPPAMTPSNLRQHLTPFGTIGRVYLAPDDRKAAHAKKLPKRAKKTLRQKSAFTEGWVEFIKKKEAKAAAEILNGRPYGGKRGSRFREDLWCIKYLGSAFKWSSLTERISYENAVREQKMRQEISHARREDKAFLGQVEKARVIKKIEEKKQDRIDRGTSKSVNQTAEKGKSLQEVKLLFRQRKPINTSTVNGL